MDVQDGRTFSERTSRKLWGPASEDERGESPGDWLRGMCKREEKDLRAARVRFARSKVRNWSPSETERQVGHELERLESGENGASGLPRLVLFFGRTRISEEAEKVSGHA